MAENNTARLILADTQTYYKATKVRQSDWQKDRLEINGVKVQK